MDRPIGVTIICILGFISTILGILIGLGTITIAGLSISFVPIELSAMISLGGFAILAINLVSLAALYLLWCMKKIGWILVMLFFSIKFIINLFTSRISALILPLIVLVYLWLIRKEFY